MLNARGRAYLVPMIDHGTVSRPVSVLLVKATIASTVGSRVKGEPKTRDPTFHPSQVNLYDLLGVFDA